MLLIFLMQKYIIKLISQHLYLIFYAPYRQSAVFMVAVAGDGGVSIIETAVVRAAEVFRGFGSAPEGSVFAVAGLGARVEAGGKCGKA